MKAVLISIQPQWCELIASGKKTIEQIKCFYESDDTEDEPQYCCNTIGENGEFYRNFSLGEKSCLTWEELRKYIGQNIKTFYGWHIFDLKIYDKPKALGEFRKPCDFTYDCCVCKRAVYKKLAAGEMAFNGCNDKITRPPQSWCYVE